MEQLRIEMDDTRPARVPLRTTLRTTLEFGGLEITVRGSLPQPAEEPFETLNHQMYMDGLVMYVTRLHGHVQAVVASGDEPEAPYTYWAQIDVQGADPHSMVRRMVALVLLVQPDHVTTEDRACAEVLASLGFHVGYDRRYEISWSEEACFPGDEPDWEEGWGGYPGMVNWSATTDPQERQTQVAGLASEANDDGS